MHFLPSQMQIGTRTPSKNEDPIAPLREIPLAKELDVMTCRGPGLAAKPPDCLAALDRASIYESCVDYGMIVK